MGVRSELLLLSVGLHTVSQIVLHNVSLLFHLTKVHKAHRF
jgi:hypothetical protein